MQGLAFRKRIFRFVFMDLGLFLSVLMCSGLDEPIENPRIPMHWTAVDSVNVNLPDGIRLYSGRNDSLPLRAWYVTIDEKRPEIFSKVVVSDDPEDGRESVSSFAHDLGATVVVNGGYFTMGQTPARHVGLLVSDGSLISTATDSALRDSVWYVTARAAVGFSGMDEIDISWAAVRNDTVFSLPAPPPNRSGNPTSRIDFSNAYIWKVRDAIGAGPTLIMDGKIRITSDEEVFFGSSIPKTHPRTAVGYTQNGVLILMVVDGRQVVSRGVDLEELASLMRDAGAVEAMNLDGGGSSTLVVNGVLINRPTGGTFEREVMSAIATFVGRGR